MGCCIRHYHSNSFDFNRIMISMNLLLFLAGVVLYIINRILLKCEIYGDLHWLMLGYFNDFVGSISFIAYCNMVSMLFCHKYFFVKLRVILILLFVCGLFWEIITPIYRTSSISDPWDIVVYMIGGITYYLIYKAKERRMSK